MESKLNNQKQKRISALEDFDAETKFLHHLFEEYFLTIYSSQYHQQLRDLENRLCALEKQRVSLLPIGQMVGIREGIGTVKQFNELLNSFRELKKDLYDLIATTEESHHRFDRCC